MKRRRWVWGMVGLALLGGVWVRLALLGSDGPYEFDFLKNAKSDPSWLDANGAGRTYLLNGDVSTIAPKLDAELRAKGFRVGSWEKDQRAWERGPTTVSVHPKRESGFSSSKKPIPSGTIPGSKSDGVTVYILHFEEETLWDKLLRKLGIRPGGSGGP